MTTERIGTTIMSFEELPSQVLSAILCGFCSGKTISTFLLTVARSNRHLRPCALPLCRGVLVQRFMELAAKFAAGRGAAAAAAAEPEIKDVIDMIREDCRLSREDEYDIVSKMSKWCAILDYFEIHLRVAKEKNKDISHHNAVTLWIVWSGTWQIPYGETHGYLCTSNWTAGAMQYWRNRELTNLSWTHTRNSSLVSIIGLPFYALLLGLDEDDERRMQLQNGVLEVRAHGHDDIDGGLPARSSLVPADEVYEINPSMALGRQKHSQSQEDAMASFLECYWDSQDGEEGDWEETVASLGDAVIRVMSMALTNGMEGREFEDFVKAAHNTRRLYDHAR